jgi:hypothetical protein
MVQCDQGSLYLPIPLILLYDDCNQIYMPFILHCQKYEDQCV